MDIYQEIRTKKPKVTQVSHASNWIKQSDRCDIFRGDYPQRVIDNDLTQKKIKK